MKKPEIVAVQNFRGEMVQQMVHEPYTLTVEAKLAMILIEKWGMVAAQDDGEDSAGRHKLKLMSPEDVIDRAFKTAELACAKAVGLGWFVDNPTYAELEAQAANRRKTDRDSN